MVETFKLLQLIEATEIAGNDRTAGFLFLFIFANIWFLPQKSVKQNNEKNKKKTGRRKLAERPTLLLILGEYLHIGGFSALPAPVWLVRCIVTQRFRQVLKDKIFRN